MISQTSHSANCVCVSCLALKQLEHEAANGTFTAKRPDRFHAVCGMVAGGRGGMFHGTAYTCFDEPAESLGTQLGYERGTPIAALNRTQRRHLAGFVKAWNRARELRGLEPMLADDALTDGLRTLEQMTKDGLAALEKSK